MSLNNTNKNETNNNEFLKSFYGDDEKFTNMENKCFYAFLILSLFSLPFCIYGTDKKIKKI